MRSQYTVMLLAAAALGSAASAEEYQPDIAEFDWDTGLSFTGNHAFNLGDGGTIEFWVAPGWESDPGYDPVVLSAVGDESFAYVIAILGDKSGLSVQSAESIDEVDFEFADGRLHHVVIASLFDAVVVMIDGRPLGQFSFVLPDVDPEVLWVGSADGESNPFAGAIGGMRFWDVEVQPEELVAFALLDPVSEAFPHPDLASLDAFSDFANNSIEITDFAWESGPDEAQP